MTATKGKSATSAGDRALRLLGGEVVEPPVCMQMYLGLYLAAPRKRAREQVYREILGQRQELELSYDEVLEAELEAWERAWALFRRPPAWLPMQISVSRAGAEGARVFADGERVLYEEARGGPVDLSAPHDPAHRDVWDRRTEQPGKLDPEELVPTFEAPDALIADQRDATRRALQRWGERHLLHTSIGTPYWACYSALGFAGMMETMRGDLALLLAIIERTLHNLLQRVKVVAASGLKCLFVEECLSSSDLISEADYLEFCHPFTRELLQAARDAGLRTVYYFCGGIEDRLEHLAALPADALAFEESKKGFVIDLGQVRGAVGPERPLLGNLDATVLRDGDAEAIRRAVGEQYRQAGPLLAMSCGSPVTLDTPPEKVDGLVEATAGCGLRTSDLRPRTTD